MNFKYNKNTALTILNIAETIISLDHCYRYTTSGAEFLSTYYEQSMITSNSVENETTSMHLEDTKKLS